MKRSFWVIESHAGVYWTGRTVRDFTKTLVDKHPIDEAVRFADFDSAERVRCYLLTDEAQRLTRSAEHLWTGEPEAETGDAKNKLIAAVEAWYNGNDGVLAEAWAEYRAALPSLSGGPKS